MVPLDRLQGCIRRYRREDKFRGRDGTDYMALAALLVQSHPKATVLHVNVSTCIETVAPMCANE